jgi:hypothetical protein
MITPKLLASPAGDDLVAGDTMLRCLGGGISNLKLHSLCPARRWADPSRHYWPPGSYALVSLVWTVSTLLDIRR